MQLSGNTRRRRRKQSLLWTMLCHTYRFRLPDMETDRQPSPTHRIRLHGRNHTGIGLHGRNERRLMPYRRIPDRKERRRRQFLLPSAPFTAHRHRQRVGHCRQRLCLHHRRQPERSGKSPLPAQTPDRKRMGETAFLSGSPTDTTHPGE